mgnify:CR=1 FL=1
MALMPKRVKHRKSQRGRIRGDASRGNRVVFGDFGLQAEQPGWLPAATIEAGRIAHTDEYEVGGGISLSSRLVKGGGYALKLPVIDISEVGAGGGSLVRFDRGGGLKVGPESAGADRKSTR